MAERRMFAKTIVSSDAFIVDLSAESQLLYFHLGMNADDDGLVNSPKRITRMIGASDDDLNALINAGFLISFDSGIVVIKHWKINNYIQKDRYKMTKYIDEFSMLETKENGAYTLKKSIEHNVYTEDVYKMYTQDRIGKDRIGKDRIGKDRIEEEAPPTSAIIDAFNEVCTNYSKVIKVTDARLKKIETLRESFSDEEIRKGFEIANKSKFINGSSDWKADFDWIITFENFVKIYEGKYLSIKKSTSAFTTMIESGVDYADYIEKLGKEDNDDIDGI